MTFEVEDPYIMRIIFEIFASPLTPFEVCGVKNKFLTEEGIPDLHLNLRFADGWIVEVQMLLRDILKIKKEAHTYYDVNRAKSPSEIMMPIFDLPYNRCRFRGVSVRSHMQACTFSCLSVRACVRARISGNV